MPVTTEVQHKSQKSCRGAEVAAWITIVLMGLCLLAFVSPFAAATTVRVGKYRLDGGWRDTSHPSGLVHLHQRFLKDCDASHPFELRGWLFRLGNLSWSCSRTDPATAPNAAGTAGQSAIGLHPTSIPRPTPPSIPSHK
jgi:hypothetical protein